MGVARFRDVYFSKYILIFYFYPILYVNNSIFKEALFILEEIAKKITEVNLEIEKVEKKLEGLPPGNFICCTSKGKSKWYVSDGHNRTYIAKKDKGLASKLAYKKYLEASLSELCARKKALEVCRESCIKIKPATDILSNCEEIRNLVAPMMVSISEEAMAWMNSTYIKNSKNPENLNHKSSSGNILRSKSETIIDMCLFNAGIPYRYEAQLVLGNRAIYPDFTIYDVKREKIVYWEHFGCMDNPEYARKACEKIMLYVANGIIPSIDLIITFETKDNPLTAEKVMSVINEYFG